MQTKSKKRVSSSSNLATRPGSKVAVPANLIVLTVPEGPEIRLLVRAERLNQTTKAYRDAGIAHQVLPYTIKPRLARAGRDTAINQTVSVSAEKVLGIAHQLIKPDAVIKWWSNPAPAYGGISPEEAVRQGQGERVIEVLSRLEEGLYF